MTERNYDALHEGVSVIIGTASVLQETPEETASAVMALVLVSLKNPTPEMLRAGQCIIKKRGMSKRWVAMLETSPLKQAAKGYGSEV